jgi:uncharacterized membrane-anchored protein
MKRLLQNFGLHPLTAIMMVCVDIMLFGADATGVGWIVSVIVAAVLTVPCVLIQKYSYQDNWGTAIAKGMFIGLLTAIPTPLPSLITGGSGLLGTAKMLRDGRRMKSTGFT